MVSLPALAGEVAVAQKQQINDLSKKLEILDQLKVKDVYRTFTVNVLLLECEFVLAFVNFRFNNASITTFFPSYVFGPSGKTKPRYVFRICVPSI